MENEHKKKKNTHHFANQRNRLPLPKVRHAINAKYSSSPEDKKYVYSSNRKQIFGEEQLNNNMVQTVKENEQEIIPRFGPWMFVMVSIDILLKG